MGKIKNIIFDLGGVFIDINYAVTRKAFIDFGIENFDELYQQDFVSTVFENLEVGKIDEIEFYNQFRIISNSNLSNQQIKQAWNAMIGEFWIDKLNFAKSLKQHYNIYLLSNTNIIHHNFFDAQFKSAFPENCIEEYFHKIYYSHKLGLRKPNANCYLKIIEEHNLKARETLFVDDTFKNIEGARKVELEVLYLRKDIDLIESITNILNFPF